MTNLKTTKRALLSSVVALLVCFTMLLGTTFAWFTDSVTSNGNIIQTGTLEIGMYWMEGDENPTTADWADASEGAIFNNTKWEPGYVEAKHIKIANEGTLALKYKLLIVPNGEVEALADVIDVYYVEGATQVTRDTLPETAVLVGTLRDMIEDTDGAVHGALLPVGETATDTYERVGEVTATIAFKMREEAGNEYKGMSIGTDFSIQLLATQYTYEEDSFGYDYDEDASYLVPVSNLTTFFNAIENGENVLLENALVIDADFVNYVNERYPAATFVMGDDTVNIDYDAIVDGGGITVYRTAETVGKPLFTVNTGYTLTLTNITIDGGAKWTGEVDPVLMRGTTNSGITTTESIITAAAGAHIVLGDGAVIQNNDGANAISLTRNTNGSSLTIKGGEIINNSSQAGAIWGGGKITLNSGKINGNHATVVGGAIRMLDNNAGNTISFTMNGGEMNHNKSDGSGGAIWSGNNAKYYLNGGEMAYNEAAAGGGAIWGGIQDVYYITGDFEMHHNVAGELGNAIRLSHYRWQPVEFEMTGGHIYANDAESGGCAIYANNNPVLLNGGVIDDVISYNGNDYLTIGNTRIDGLVEFNHDGRGDYKILLAQEFVGFNYIVEVDDALFPQFMLDPSDDYVYTEGDESKLVCMNEGYETYCP